MNERVRTRLLKLTVFLIILNMYVCIVAADFLVCRYIERFAEGSEWMYSVLYCVVLAVSFKVLVLEKGFRLTKRMLLCLTAAVCIAALAIGGIAAYFNSEKVHNFFTKNRDNSLIATVWYYEKEYMGSIYKFDIYGDRRVVYNYSYIPDEKTEFSPDIMDRVDAQEPPLLSSQPEGSCFISGHKYNNIVSRLELLQDKEQPDETPVVRNQYRPELACYMYYKGEIHNISSSDETLKNDMLLSLFKCTGYNNPDDLWGWDDLVDYEREKNWSVFVKIFKPCLCVEIILMIAAFILFIKKKQA